MKILFIEKQDSVNAGTGVYSQEIICRLIKKGHEVTPIHYGDRLLKSDQNNTIHIPCQTNNSLSYFFRHKSLIKNIEKIIIKESPDIIHISFGLLFADLSIVRTANKYHIPTVGIMHMGFCDYISLANTLIKTIYLSYLKCFSEIDKVLVFSKNVADFLITKGVSSKNIAVVPNSVDTNIYSPGKSDFKNKNKIKFAYLFLGRLDRQKNPDILIESFLKINPPPDQKLIIVGSGTSGTLGNKLVVKYKNHPQIIFTGSICDLKEKVDIMRAGDVFVLPSSFEGMSFALLEAMSCGLAPVCTDAGNHREVVNNDRFVVDHNKIREQLPSAMQIFSNNPASARSFGKKARKVILQKYDLDKNIDQLISIYKEVIARRKNGKKTATPGGQRL